MDETGGSTLGDLDYDYDVGGRRNAVFGSYARTGLPTTLSSATYNAANELTSWAGTSVTSDANSSLTSDGTISYSRNNRGQLASLSGAGTSASFAYDAFGRRQSLTVNGQTSSFLYDGFNVVRKLSGGSPSANLLTGLVLDETFRRTDSAGARDFLTDALGSTIALVDSVGAVQTSYTYEPFGAATPGGETSSNSFQYTGRENDGTGLLYLRSRYYSPTLQRFLSEDPLGLAGGDANGYAYVSNQPTGRVDPLGLCGLGFGGLLNTMRGRCGFWDPITRFYEKNRRAISCGLLAAALITGVTGAPIEIYETIQALKAAPSVGRAILRWGVGRTHLALSGLFSAGSIGCFL